VETLTHELNLERRVLRFDHVPYSDLPKYYSAADVFVLPSIDRGSIWLGSVESMAFWKVEVCSNNGCVAKW